MILELCYGKAHSRFDGDVSDHCHIRCLKCERVDDVPPLESKELEEVARSTEYEVIGYRLEFFGICPSCLSDGDRYV